MGMNEAIDYLITAQDEEYAEFFVKFIKLIKIDPDGTTPADEISIDESDMRNFNLEDVKKYITDALDEIIFSDDIVMSAWWKGQTI